MDLTFESLSDFLPQTHASRDGWLVLRPPPQDASFCPRYSPLDGKKGPRLVPLGYEQGIQAIPSDGLEIEPAIGVRCRHGVDCSWFATEACSLEGAA